MTMSKPHNAANMVLCDAAEVQGLRQQSERLAHLLDVMPAGVVVVDNTGTVKQANRVAIELLGEPLEGEAWRTIIARSFRPQADDGHEVSLHDGRKVKLQICPLQNEPGQLIVLTDLTETRRLQERVSHMQRLSSLGRMVASLAHQIRTPLSAAMLYAANMGSSMLTEAARQKFTEKLLSRLKDLEQQVNDMLLFAKSGSEQVVGEISLQQLLQEVQQGSEAMLQHANTELQVSLPEPDILVLGNKTALASALQNLIHNALQHIGERPCIWLSATRSNNAPGQVDIQVRDNGCGLADKVKGRLFEPFFTTRSQGTGLGLAVVKAVAQSHKGQALADNHPDGGAVFTLRLPIEKLSSSQTAAVLQERSA